MNIESMTSRKQVKTEKKREVGEGLGEREGRGKGWGWWSDRAQTGVQKVAKNIKKKPCG